MPDRLVAAAGRLTGTGCPGTSRRTPRDERPGHSWAGTPAVRARMHRQRTRDTGRELAFRRLLLARGLPNRVDVPPLPGLLRRADVVFRPPKVAVIVDGCFRHGCPAQHTPRINPGYWTDKVARNRDRDVNTGAHPKAHGWLPLRCREDTRPAVAAAEVGVAVDIRRALRRSGRVAQPPQGHPGKPDERAKCHLSS
jgi:DNA mismatch endonuclease (patch repair protein)